MGNIDCFEKNCKIIMGEKASEIKTDAPNNVGTSVGTNGNNSF